MGKADERETRSAFESPPALASAIVQSIRYPLVVLDPNLRVRLANREFYRAFRVSERETVDVSFRELGDGQWHIEKLGEFLQQVITKHEGFDDFEVAYEFPDIGTRTMLVSARAITSVELDADLALLSFEDITERLQLAKEQERLQEQLLHTQKLESLGVLSGGLAHDFNNILVGVLGNAELAHMELPPESGARTRLEDLTKAAQRAADLTKQMLAYAGKGKFVVELVSLNTIAEEMLHLLQASISKTVVLDMHLADNLPLIEGDVTQMRQILMNLIINASEAIGNRSGLVSVRTGVMEVTGDCLSETYIADDLADGYFAYIEVSDTGVGMDEEIVEKVFDPFFTTKFAGRGLGLAAVLGIVRGHSGAIKVYSQPGQGTTFKVLLPCAPSSLEQPRGEIEALPAVNGRQTALVVDDEENVVTVAKQLLEKHGLSVLTAHDGREAVDVFRSRSDEIAVVLLDLTMPHLSGEETFRELRRIRRDVCVVLSSGYNEQDITNRFAGKGLAGFVQKPYLPGALIDAVRRALELMPPPEQVAGDDVVE